MVAVLGVDGVVACRALALALAVSGFLCVLLLFRFPRLLVDVLAFGLQLVVETGEPLHVSG